jgi:hypothetical protein
MSALGPDADLLQRQLLCRLLGVKQSYAQREFFRLMTDSGHRGGAVLAEYA